MKIYTFFHLRTKWPFVYPNRIWNIISSHGRFTLFIFQYIIYQIHFIFFPFLFEFEVPDYFFFFGNFPFQITFQSSPYVGRIFPPQPMFGQQHAFNIVYSHNRLIDQWLSQVKASFGIEQTDVDEMFPKCFI